MNSEISLKDRDRIFSKLSISPFYISTIQPPLLLSPDFLILLLQQSAHASVHEQNKLLHDILNLFVQRPTNSILLNHADSLSRKDLQKGIMDEIILKILSLVESEEQFELFQQKISLLLAYYRIGLKNINKLLQMISKQAHEGQFNYTKLVCIVRILKIYYGQKLGTSNSPNFYFYFLGAENSGIQPVFYSTQDLLSFKNQFFFCIVFNSQGNIEDFTKTVDPSQTSKANLLYLKLDSKEEIKVNCCEGKIKIVIEVNGKFLDEIIIFSDLNDQVWNRLLINFSTNSTDCELNGNEKKFRSLLKREKQKKIKTCVIGQEFFGMLTSVILANKVWSFQKFHYNGFRFGVQNWDSLVLLNKLSLGNSVILSCFPFSTFDVRGSSHCFDIFKRNHSSISENIIIVNESVQQQKLSNVGGCDLLLPLFYLTRFYSSSQSPILLEETLNLLLCVIQNFQESQIAAQFHNGAFLQIFGQHLKDLAPHQTLKSIKILQQIYKRLYRQEIKSIFIKHVLWNLNLVATAQLQNNGQEMIIRIYQNERSLAKKAFGFDEIAYWMIHNLQNPHICCCLQHYVNQSFLAQELQLHQVATLHASLTKFHYYYLEIILSNMLTTAVVSNKQNQASCMVTTLLRLLLRKYSTCLYLTVLHVISKQIEMSKVQMTAILSEDNVEILSFLVFMSEKTINPEALTEIVFIASFMSQHHSKINRRQDFLHFLLHLFKINQQLFVEAKRHPIVEGLQKLRKNTYNRKTETKSQSQKLSRSKSVYNLTYKHLCPDQRNSSAKQISRQIVEGVKNCPQPQRISNWTPLFNLILNFLSGSTSRKQPSDNGILNNPSNFLILKEYYQLCCNGFKQKILLYVLSLVSKYPVMREIKSLNIFLLQNLAKNQGDNVDHECQQTTLIAIFSCIFSQIISSLDSVALYYSSLKFIRQTKTVISNMLYKVIPKVIKLMTIDQLCEMLVICKYENVESACQTNYTLITILLQQIHRTLKRQLCIIIDVPMSTSFSSLLLQSINNLQAMQFVKQFQLFMDSINSLGKQNERASGKFLKFSKILEQVNNLIEESKINEIQAFLTSKSLKCQLNLSPVKSSSSSSFQQEGRRKSQTSSSSDNHKKRERDKNSIEFTKMNTKKQLYFFQIYLNFVKEISQRCEDKQEREILQEESKFVMQLYCVSKSQLEDLQVVFYHTYLFMFLNRSNMPMIENLWHSILNHIIPLHENSSSKSLIKEEKYTIFEVLWENFIKKYQRSEYLEENKDYFLKREVMRDVLDQMQGLFEGFQDQNILLIVEKYQNDIQFFTHQYQLLIQTVSNNAALKNIQKLFDLENAIQQRNRIKILYQSQCQFRKFHAQWDRIWTKLRIYHESYGFWMAQRASENIFTYPSQKVKNFRYQMSEYASNIGLTPILEAKIIQPWHVIKDNKIKQNKYIDSFADIVRPSQIQNARKTDRRSFINSIWRNMVSRKSSNSAKIKQYETVWICRSNKALGKLFIHNQEQLVFCYDSVRQDDSHISFQKFSLPYNRETYLKWNIYKIKKIKVHRYLLKYHALEFKMMNGTSIIFNFINEDKDNFLRELDKIQRDKLITHGGKIFRMNKIYFFSEKLLEMGNFNVEYKVTESWRKRQISNLEYLVYLNNMASRGIYDLSQYFVLPWVAEQKNDKQPKLRDLSKTMGALGSPERQALIKEKFYSHDPFNPYPPFFYGTHYSSPGVVFNFLIRISPFTQYCKHLQGGKFDIADRLFCSLINAWKSATVEVSDVRELVPQFYYIPQILINLDQYNFGVTQSKEKVNHVEIPMWSTQNPYLFVSLMRIMLESEQVSNALNDWIDLIFGYKQQGKKAEQNLNVFYYLTYEAHANLDQQQEQVYRKSKQSQIVHFGQIPPMLFDKPHPKRNPITMLSLHQLKFSKKIILASTFKQKPIGLKIWDHQLLIIKRSQMQIYSTLSNPAALQKRKKINIEKSMTDSYYLLKKQKSNICFFGRHYFIIWGYFNHQFRIYNKNTVEIEESDMLESTITSLFVNEEETLILVGLQSGLLVVYEIQYGATEIFINRVDEESFPAPITHINEYDGFYSFVFGNYVGIYKIERTLHFLISSQENSERTPKKIFKFFRSFTNSLPIKAAFIMSSPLFSIILVDNANIKSYSINGQFIRGIFSNAGNSKVVGRFQDHQLHDAFYALEEDKVICYSIPDLRSMSILELPEDNEYLGENCFTLSSRRNEIWQFRFMQGQQE